MAPHTIVNEIKPLNVKIENKKSLGTKIRIIFWIYIYESKRFLFYMQLKLFSAQKTMIVCLPH